MYSNLGIFRGFRWVYGWILVDKLSFIQKESKFSYSRFGPGFNSFLPEHFRVRFEVRSLLIFVFKGSLYDPNTKVDVSTVPRRFNN